MKTNHNAKIPLHRMAVFTPGRQNEDEIRASYIARPALLDMILEDIQNTRSASIPQHHLIIGQRGIGKTTLLKRIQVALCESPFAEQFIPLGFPEEQYSVDRLSTVFLNCLDSLADTLEHEEGAQDLVDRIDAAVERLRMDRATDEIVAEDAERTLMDFAKESGRRPVLLIDNLDLIFDRLKKPELHHLRAFLMKSGAPILIGASVHPPEDNYEAPFYDHFKPHFLSRLSLDEMREVLLKLAERAGNQEIPARINQEKGRLHALHALTGGNPRTTRILFEIFAHGFSQEAYEDLEALLDWMTPIYKARFEELSDQAQVIVGAIATIWEPAVLSRICEATRLKPNQISPQLDRLKKSGVIEEVTVDPPDRVGPIPDQRTPQDRTGYQLAERFFNIWFLMRQATRRDKRNLIYLTRFIECLYTSEERVELAEGILEKQELSKAEKAYGLALEQSLQQQHLRLRLHDHLIHEFIQAKNVRLEQIEDLIDPAEIPTQRWTIAELRSRLCKAVPSHSGIEPDEFADAILSAPVLVGRRDEIATALLTPEKAEELMAEARESLATIITLFGEAVGTWLASLFKAGIVIDFKKTEDTESAILRADSKDKMLACLMLGTIGQSAKGLSDEAFDAVTASLQPDDTSTQPGEWLEWAERCADLLGRKAEAITAYERVMTLDSKHAEAARRVARLLDDTNGGADRILAAWRRAAALNPENGFSLTKLGTILCERFGRVQEAEKAYNEALRVQPDYSWAWFNLSQLQNNYLGDPNAAEHSLRRAVELESENAFYLYRLADLLATRRGKAAESESIYRKALEIEPESELYLVSLANLIAKKPTRHNEAIAALRLAVETDPESVFARANLARLLGEREKTKDKAVNEWIEVLKRDPRHSGAWLSLAMWMQQNDDPEQHRQFLYNAVKSADRPMLLRMVRLWGMLSGRPSVGKELLETIREATPSEYRHELLFDEIMLESSEENWGNVSEALAQLVDRLGERLIFPQEDRDSWIEMSAALLHFGHGEKLLQTMTQLGADQRLRPWTEALRAHVRGDRKYLRNSPAEVRGTAGQMYDEINSTLKKMPRKKEPEPNQPKKRKR